MKVLYFLIWNTPIAAFSVFWKHYDPRLSLSRLSSVSGSTGKRDDDKHADFWKIDYKTDFWKNETDFWKNGYGKWEDEYFTAQEKLCAITSEDKPEQLTYWRERKEFAYSMMIFFKENLKKAVEEEEKEKAEAEEKRIYFYEAWRDKYVITTIDRSSLKDLLYENDIPINEIYKIGRKDDDGKFQPTEEEEWINKFESIVDGLVYEMRSLRK